MDPTSVNSQAVGDPRCIMEGGNDVELWRVLFCMPEVVDQFIFERLQKSGIKRPKLFRKVSSVDISNTESSRLKPRTVEVFVSLSAAARESLLKCSAAFDFAKTSSYRLLLEEAAVRAWNTECASLDEVEPGNCSKMAEWLSTITANGDIRAQFKISTVTEGVENCKAPFKKRARRCPTDDAQPIQSSPCSSVGASTEVKLRSTQNLTTGPTSQGAESNSSQLLHEADDSSGRTVTSSLSFERALQLLYGCVDLEISRRTLIVRGNYIKNNRHMSQSKWMVSDSTRSEGFEGYSNTSVPTSSLEEVFGRRFQELFLSDNPHLHAAGREDVDVRMLGSGRPFVLLVPNPRDVMPETLLKAAANSDSSLLDKNPEQVFENFLNATEAWRSNEIKIININITSESLEHGKSKALKQIHALSEGKRKVYGCVCLSTVRDILTHDIEFLSSYIMKQNGGEPLLIRQRTPTRVIHRRVPACRTKLIFSIRGYLVSKRIFLIIVEADAGTYIKELVHGDFRRTKPSISELLGTPIRLLQLDVLRLSEEHLTGRAQGSPFCVELPMLGREAVQHV